jgi:hypothetical protein
VPVYRSLEIIKDDMSDKMGYLIGSFARDCAPDNLAPFGLHVAMSGITSACAIWANVMRVPMRPEVIRTIRPFILEILMISIDEMPTRETLAAIELRMVNALAKFAQ